MIASLHRITSRPCPAIRLTGSAVDCSTDSIVVPLGIGRRNHKMQIGMSRLSNCMASAKRHQMPHLSLRLPGSTASTVLLDGSPMAARSSSAAGSCWSSSTNGWPTHRVNAGLSVDIHLEGQQAQHAITDSRIPRSRPRRQAHTEGLTR
ncbi:MAG: hypothetical protein CM15mP92_1980 [Halieaceae bacterium]|nr:MAG: hypothetical protein CM15mP92_1980 [Halieaceae bacterium]